MMDRHRRRTACACPLCSSRSSEGDAVPQGVPGVTWVPLVRPPRSALVACSQCRRSVANVSSLLAAWQESGPGTRRRVYRCPSCDGVAEREGEAVRAEGRGAEGCRMTSVLVTPVVHIREKDPEVRP